MGREALKYVGKTAEEVSGIGPAQRAYRRTMLAQKDIYDKMTVFNGALCNGVANGMERIVFPLLHKSSGGSGHEVGEIVKGGIDLIVVLAAVGWARFGDHKLDALIAKVGYNTLVQIAPDVVRLAKGKIFQRTK